MKIIEDIYLKGNDKAVLLLHSFTSNSKEMLSLANALHDAGYTCYAPNLAGHGASPEYLFASSIEQIMEGGKKAIQFLIEEKYETIYVIGQSLGGVMNIRLANAFPASIAALGIISSPVMERPVEGLADRVAYFSKRYMQNRGSSDEEVTAFFDAHFPRPVEKFIALQQFIVNTRNEIGTVKQPLFLAKGALDEPVFQQSIDIIADHAASGVIVKKQYENSGHLITLGKERGQLAQDIVAFFGQIEREAVPGLVNSFSR